MENEVEAVVREGEGLCHVGADDGDVVALPFGDDPLAFQLLLGIVQHGAFRPQRRENGHLLSAAAGKAEDALSIQVAEPVMGDRLGGGENHVPVSVHSVQIRFVGDRQPPLPAVFHPPIDGGGVDILIMQGNPSNSIPGSIPWI